MRRTSQRSDAKTTGQNRGWTFTINVLERSVSNGRLSRRRHANAFNLMFAEAVIGIILLCNMLKETLALSTKLKF